MANPPTAEHALGDRGLSELTAVTISALVGLLVAAGSLIAVQGVDVFYETLTRVEPTVEGGGIGTDFTGGASEPTLALLIEVVHIADLAMGLFILLMVFVHWGAFRRIAARMQPAVEPPAATDGGQPASDETNGGDGQ